MRNVITPKDIYSVEAVKKFGARPSGAYMEIGDDLYCFKPDELDDAAEFEAGAAAGFGERHAGAVGQDPWRGFSRLQSIFSTIVAPV